MTDWEGIDGIRFKAVEIEGNREIDVNLRVLATLVASLCGVLHDQGIEQLGALEKQVVYLKHLSEQRGALWGTLEKLADEVRLVREQLVDRSAELDAREADLERRERELQENARQIIERLDGEP